DDDGRVPLMVHWHSVLYDTLLKHGANPNACDSRGNTVLMYQRRNQGLVDMLLDAGADVNAKNKDGVALITLALEEGLPIQPLLDAGAIWQTVTREQKDLVFRNCLPTESIEVLSRIMSDIQPSEDTFHYALVWSACHDQEKFIWLKGHSHFYSSPTRSFFSGEEAKILEAELELRSHDAKADGFKKLLSDLTECLDNPLVLNKHLVKATSLYDAQNLETFAILLKAKNTGVNCDNATASSHIHAMARFWLSEYHNTLLSENELVKFFPDICQLLGFEMDSGQALYEAFPDLDVLGDPKVFKRVYRSITSVQVLGNAIFSKFRRITHWSMENLNSLDNQEWFRLAFAQLHALTE
ncbi:MAG: hypothetical protein IJT83_07165, partial [Victivallales bacterium]|nr:hypothetical protein [Victivallales bacterium]